MINMAGVEIILFLTAYSITILFQFNNSLGLEVGVMPAGELPGSPSGSRRLRAGTLQRPVGSVCNGMGTSPGTRVQSSNASFPSEPTALLLQSCCLLGSFLAAKEFRELH